MANKKKKTKAKAPRSIVDDVKTLRDDARVRLHLAGNEVRDAWDTLSKQAEGVAIKLERSMKDAQKAPATQAARLKLHLGIMELQQRWDAVQPALHAFSTAIEKKGEEAAAALRSLPNETQKLQARLAEMDAQDAVAARLEQARTEIAKAKASSQRALASAGKTFKDAVKTVKKALA